MQMKMCFDGTAEAYEDKMVVQGFMTMVMTILMVEKLVVAKLRRVAEP